VAGAAVALLAAVAFTLRWRRGMTDFAPLADAKTIRSLSASPNETILYLRLSPL
jgi:hypothetical protein